ncbi:hypothetical protein VNO77_02737 [Canavalia gladiata]|uniref:Uncharacterized protein n=1 Tax=Canavalia gladiata TaxID=3824 RepID=A0AAN9N008_CANGL
MAGTPVGSSKSAIYRAFKESGDLTWVISLIWMLQSAWFSLLQSSQNRVFRLAFNLPLHSSLDYECGGDLEIAERKKKRNIPKEEILQMLEDKQDFYLSLHLLGSRSGNGPNRSSRST